jgi:hypothetical protein
MYVAEFIVNAQVKLRNGGIVNIQTPVMLPKSEQNMLTLDSLYNRIASIGEDKELLQMQKLADDMSKIVSAPVSPAELMSAAR